MSERTAEQEAPKLRLTDEGVDTPEELVGRAGTVVVEKPEIQMEMHFTGDGIQKPSTQLLTFPPTDKDPIRVPEGDARIDGTFYEDVYERDLNECPHCGSDKVAAHDEPPKCYGCDRTLRPESDQFDGGGS
jgi:hypothetical protein